MMNLALVFDLLMLLFWLRLWSAPDKEFFFNPFLSGTVRLTDSVFAFLRPALRVPDPVLALLAFLFLGTFKTLVIARQPVPFTLLIGSAFQFATPANGDLSWPPFFLFSALDLFLFLARLWTVYFLVTALSFQQRATRATETFAYFSRPFSQLPFLLQPVALLLLHGVLALALARTGVLADTMPGQDAQTAASASPFLTGPLFLQLLKTGWLAILSLADGLALLTRALFILILGNFAAAILQLSGFALLCHEAVELLLGRFARNRAATGMGLDFTPLIFFFVVSVTYDGLRAGLYSLIRAPFFQ